MWWLHVMYKIRCILFSRRWNSKFDRSIIRQMDCNSLTSWLQRENLSLGFWIQDWKVVQARILVNNERSSSSVSRVPHLSETWILDIPSAIMIATRAVEPFRWQAFSLHVHLMISGPICDSPTKNCLPNCTHTSATLYTGWQRARVSCFALEQVLITSATVRLKIGNFCTTLIVS